MRLTGDERLPTRREMVRGAIGVVALTACGQHPMILGWTAGKVWPFD